MAKITKIQKSHLNLSARIDAEHYSPRFAPVLHRLACLKTIKLRRTLLEPVKTGHTPSTINREYYEPGVVKFVKTDNLRKDRIDTYDIQLLSELGNATIAGSELHSDDVIVTIIGATEDIIGRAARIHADLGRANINQNVALIRSRIPAGYLTVFLNSRYGREQLIWLSRQTGQVNLNCREVEELTIPLFAEQFIVAVHNLSSERHRLLFDSIKLYSEAEQLLFSELGLQIWEPPHTLVYVRNYSKVERARRLDAEHFQPKYDSLFSIIRANAKYYRRVKDFRAFNSRGSQPTYSEAGTLKVINSRHILERQLDYDNFERAEFQYWDLQSEARVFKHDILIYTTGANVGRTNIYLEDEKVLASNHVNILRLRAENPIYVGFVLNSMIGRLQTRRLVTGTAQAELYPSDIDDFLVPFITQEKQKKIVTLVQQAHTAQREAKAILEKANLAVEMAIEKGEDQAMEFISIANQY